MSNKVNEIKKVLKSGAKATKYRVFLSIPKEVPIMSELRDMNVLCKATSFPSMTIGQIEVWNQGRKLVIPGDTSYENNWTCTFYADSSHKQRKDFISWMKACDNFQANTHSGNPGGLFVDLKVVQLDSLEKEVATYTFHNAWPNTVGEIAIGADSIDTLQEYDVIFSFSDWVIGETEFNTPIDNKKASENIISVDQ